jgi:hypothetical protein
MDGWLMCGMRLCDGGWGLCGQREVLRGSFKELKWTNTIALALLYLEHASPSSTDNFLP